MHKDEIIKDLKNGVDENLRESMCRKIWRVIAKSRAGEIGWVEYIKEVRDILAEAELLAKDNWEE
jgi:hypothetical protein